MLLPGQQLRRVREQLGLTMRAVEVASARLAAKHNNLDFAIAPSRLFDIETKGVVPNIYRLYSLAAIYRRTLNEILGWYGINASELAAEAGLIGARPRYLPEVIPNSTKIAAESVLDRRHTPRRNGMG